MDWQHEQLAGQLRRDAQAEGLSDEDRETLEEMAAMIEQEGDDAPVEGFDAAGMLREMLGS